MRSAQPHVSTHVLILNYAFLYVTCALQMFMCTPLAMCECVLVCDLCYSLSIVKESVKQDPDPPAGTNQTHSLGLNGQLTIREPL